MSPTSDLPTRQPVDGLAEQAALACYLSMVVAIGNCMAEVCPPVGAMYRERFLKLPRRLGFDPTPEALRESREAMERDLSEYSTAASATIGAGLNHAAMLLDHLRATEEKLTTAADLQRTFLQDLAEQIEIAAEVDPEGDLRASFKHYAAGLKAYSRKARSEKLAMIEDLRTRREEIDDWLAEATMSKFIDTETGLLNRAAAERRILSEIGKAKPFCVILVGCNADSGPSRLKKAAAEQIVKHLAERLAATIRPYDVIFRWSQDHIITIFEASRADIATRAVQISGWLGDDKCVLEIDGETSVVKTRGVVTVLEHLTGETVDQMIARVESVGSLSAV
jgi:GGDEF domain-containing protein